MFGYVTINKPELKIKDFIRYKAYYCGLCKCLQRQYGWMGQMTLTYDMTFAIIFLTSLYESRTEAGRKRCIVHPVRKHETLENEFTEYASAMNVILAYYHMKDDWEDEQSAAGLVGMKVLRRRVRRIEEQYKRQSSVIKETLKELRECEQSQSTDIDRVSGCFGRLMEELFVYREDRWEQGLRRFGFYLGKYIYIMDAYEDAAKDIEHQNYNPLKEQYGHPLYEENCRQMLTMMLGECCSEFEKFPCVLDEDILRNILYGGVWVQYNKVQSKLEKGAAEYHDQ